MLIATELRMHLLWEQITTNVDHAAAPAPIRSGDTVVQFFRREVAQCADRSAQCGRESGTDAMA